MEAIKYRRSIRDYAERKVERDRIERVLRAAMQAPSACNQQAWEFIVVENKEKLLKLSQIDVDAKPLEKAPVTIILVANKDVMKAPDFWQQDLAAATENLLLEATHLALGAYWLTVAPKEEKMQYIRDEFNLPENILPFAIIPMGYPKKENTFIDRYDEKKIHYEEWS